MYDAYVFKIHSIYIYNVDGKSPTNHLVCMKPVTNHGISTTNLNLLSRRISEPSTVLYILHIVLDPT